MRGSACPAARTISAVRSVEPSSTTMISCRAQRRSATFVAAVMARSMFASSFSAGRMIESSCSAVAKASEGTCAGTPVPFRSAQHDVALHGEGARPPPGDDVVDPVEQAQRRLRQGHRHGLVRDAARVEDEQALLEALLLDREL